MADISVLIPAESVRVSETVTVPTRIYFPSGTVPIETATIAFDAAWVETAAAVRRKMVTDGRKRGTAAASITVTSTATNPEKHLHAQYVSGPLLAQTIAGSVRGQFRCVESNAALNGTLNIGIRVVSADGQTVRATLLAVGGTVTTATTPPEFATSLTNRQLLTSGDVTPLSLTSYTCVEGDRLVIEIGSADKDAGNVRTAGISFGDNTVDLQTDDTTTTANDPWVEFNSTIRFQNAVETIRVSDGGVTQMMNRGWIRVSEELSVALQGGGDLSRNLANAEIIKVSDGPAVPAIERSASLSEAIIVADTVIASRETYVPVTGEAIRIADSTQQTLDPEQASSSESVRVQDTVTAMIVLLVSLTESIKVVDSGQGRTELLGVVHVTDGPVIAALASGGDLTSNAGTEAVRVADTLTASRDLTASVSEAIVLGDTVSAIRDLTASLQEVIKVSESQDLTLDPEEAALSEAIKITDTAAGAVNLAAFPALTDAIRVSDATAATLDPLQAFLTEIIRVADVNTSDVALGGAPSAESLRVADLAQAQLDTIQVQVADDVVRVADASITGQPTLIQAAVASELVRVSDRVVIIQAFLTETIKVSDSGQGRTALIGVLKIQDGPVIAQLGSILSAGPSETIKVGDSLSALRSPTDVLIPAEVVKIGYTQSAVEYTQDEYIKIGDAVSAFIGAPTELSAALADEVVKIADAGVGERTLERLIAAEAVVLSDAVTAARDLTVVVAPEGIIPADSVTARRDLTAVLTETVKVGESTLLRELDPLERLVDPTEVRIGDTDLAVFRGFDTELAVNVQAEILHLEQTLIVASDLVVSLEEVVRIGEVLDGGYGQALSVLVDPETFTAIDSLEPAITPLQAGLEQEDILIGDSVEVVQANPAFVEEGLGVDDAQLLAAMDLATDIGEPDEAFPIIKLSGDVFLAPVDLEETLQAPIELDDDELTPGGS